MNGRFFIFFKLHRFPKTAKYFFYFCCFWKKMDFLFCFCRFPVQRKKMMIDYFFVVHTCTIVIARLTSWQSQSLVGSGAGLIIRGTVVIIDIKHREDGWHRLPTAAYKNKHWGFPNRETRKKQQTLESRLSIIYYHVIIKWLFPESR